MAELLCGVKLERHFTSQERPLSSDVLQWHYYTPNNQTTIKNIIMKVGWCMLQAHIHTFYSSHIYNRASDTSKRIDRNRTLCMSPGKKINISQGLLIYVNICAHHYIATRMTEALNWQ